MATRKTLVLETRVAELGGQVRALKETKAEKTEVAAAVQRLLEAKARLDDAYNGRVRALQEAVEASGRPAAESMRAAIDELVTARAMLYAKKRHQKAAKADEAGEAAAPAPRRQRSKSDPNVAAAATAAAAASSHAAPNELPWPETEALPKVVCARVKQYLHAEASFKAAAADERPAREAHAREALAELHGLLHSSRACASQKLDGTNVAVLADGGLAGRRQMIADGASEYQRTPLAAARAVDAAAVRRHLAPTLAACGGAAARLAVFGELMCNGDIYGYAGTGLVDGAFRAFGVVFVPETKPGGAEDGGADGAASDLVARLRERGWAANKVGGGACCAAAVRLALNRPLMALLGAAGVPTVPVVEVGLGGGLCALVSRHEAWMLEMAGEAEQRV